MDIVFVKPAAGSRIRQPEREGRVMPDEGAHVPRNDFYERLIISGDVVLSEEPKGDQPKPAKPKQTL